MIGFVLSLMIASAMATPFRVLVFPHQGNYSAPEGREKVISEVTVTSTENCDEYAAILYKSREWGKTGNLIASAKSFQLTAKTSGRFYFECKAPFKVVRESSLESYSYEGNFVAVIDQSADQNGTGKIQLVNLIDSEKYVQGVVPSEVGNNWPLEALKAQAVAARTFSWWHVLEERSNPVISISDLDDTVLYQVYLGTSNHTTSTDQSVSLTSGQVIKYNGKVIQAYFSADSAGKSESAEKAFGSALPYCVGKSELYDLSKIDSAWSVKMSLADVSRKLGKKIKLIEVLPTDIDDSGRVSQVSITDENGAVSKLSGVFVREELKLKSTLFQLSTVTEQKVEFLKINGKGFGHGVGLAQMGAKVYAEMGWSFEQIIKFYYTGVTLGPVTDAYYEE